MKKRKVKVKSLVWDLGGIVALIIGQVIGSILGLGIVMGLVALFRMLRGN